MQASTRQTWRIVGSILFYGVLVLGFAYVVYVNRQHLDEVATALRRGRWYYVGAGSLIMLVVLYNHAALYASIYQLLGLSVKAWQLLPYVLIGRFVVVALPSSGLSAWAPFFEDARRRRLPAGRVLAVILIHQVLWYMALTVMVLAGLVVLYLARRLEWYFAAAGFLLLATDLVFIAIIVLAGAAPKLLNDMLRAIIAPLNRLTGWVRLEPVVTFEQLDKFIDDLTGAARQSREAPPRMLARPALHAILNELLFIGVLFFLTRAFDVNFDLGLLLSLHATTILFYVISPTPGGIGFVEGSLISVLIGLNLQDDLAVAFTLAYRGVIFWLPFLIGFVALRWLRAVRRTSGPSQPDAV